MYFKGSFVCYKLINDWPSDLSILNVKMMVVLIMFWKKDYF